MPLPSGNIDSVVLDAGAKTLTVHGTAATVEDRLPITIAVAVQQPVDPGQALMGFVAGPAVLGDGGGGESWEAALSTDGPTAFSAAGYEFDTGDVLVIATQTYFLGDPKDPRTTASFTTFTWSQVMTVQ